MKKPTPAKIKSELTKLIAMKPNVRHSSAFGDDHHAAIDAQIEVMENDLLEAEIYDRSDESITCEEEIWPENAREAALDCRRWMDGEEDISPCKNWESLVIK